MRAALPAPPSRIDQFYMTQLLQQVTRAFGSAMSASEAVPRITLLSPGGVSWDVVVSDAGVLSTVRNTGQINPSGGHQP